MSRNTSILSGWTEQQHPDVLTTLGVTAFENRYGRDFWRSKSMTDFGPAAYACSHMKKTSAGLAIAIARHTSA